MLTSSAPALDAVELALSDQPLGFRRVRRRQHDDVALRRADRAGDRAARRPRRHRACGSSARRRIAEMRNPNGAAIFTTPCRSRRVRRCPCAVPASVRTSTVGPSSSSCAHRCATCARIATGSWRASAIVTPSTCSAIDARADAAGAGDHDGAREQLGKHQAADADRRALHPPQARRRRKYVAIDKRRERDVGLRQQPPQRVAIPGVEECVLRKIAAELVDEMARHHPGGRGADHGDEDVHRLPSS